MSEFQIQVNRIDPQVQKLQSCEKKVSGIAADVRSLAGRLSIEGESREILRTRLLKIADDIDDRSGEVCLLAVTMSKIHRLYMEADGGVKELSSGSEENIIDGQAATSAAAAGSGSAENKNDTEEEGWWSRFWDHFREDLLSEIIDSTGQLFVTLGGYFNYMTAYVHGPAGPKSFVILNPRVLETTGKYISFGKWTSGFAKYGLPVIGGLIDYYVLRKSGNDVGESIVKAGAHTGIGLAAGAAGAAVGTAIGSVIPVAGNAAGAVIGFVVGVVIGTTGDAGFDYVYDNWSEITDSVREAGNQALFFGERVVDAVEEGVEAVLDSVTSFCNGIGECAGTVFGW